MSGDLKDLLARVEAATGPDRELDHALLMHVSASGEFLRSNGYVRTGDLYVTTTPPLSGAERCSGPQYYTASLDASLALMEEKLPGVFVEISGPRKYLNIPTPIPNHWKATLDGVLPGWGSTAALSVCATLLRALISKGDQHG